MRLTTAKMFDDLGSSPVTQLLTARAIDRAEELLLPRRGVLRRRVALVDELLHAHLPEWTWERPRAGIYAWLSHPGDPSEEIQHLARHLGVQVGSGSALSLDNSHTACTKISLVADGQELGAGFALLGDAWRALSDRPPATEGLI